MSSISSASSRTRARRAEIERAALEVIDEPAWRADDDVHALGERAPRAGRPCPDARRDAPARRAVEPGELALHLDRELARRRDDEGAGHPRLAERRLRAEERLGHREPERDGLARAGARGDEQVAAAVGRVEHRRLDRCRLDIAAPVERGKERRVGSDGAVITGLVLPWRTGKRQALLKVRSSEHPEAPAGPTQHASDGASPVERGGRDAGGSSEAPWRPGAQPRAGGHPRCRALGRGRVARVGLPGRARSSGGSRASGLRLRSERALRLADTGLYQDASAERVAADVLAYTPQYPLWSDGATKRRWIRLPPGAAIDASDPDAWVFPIGTQIWKEFSFGGRVETR